MPYQPVRTAPPPPPPQRNVSRANTTNNNSLILFDGLIGSDKNNNEQKGPVTMSGVPQKKVPPPRPAPPKNRYAVSSSSQNSNTKLSNASKRKSGLGKYFNLRTGRAVSEKAQGSSGTARHTKRRAPLPPRPPSRKPPAPLIDFSSPPLVAAQKAAELTLLDIDFDEKGSDSLLDIDPFFQPADSRSVSSVSSGGSAAPNWSHGALDDLFGQKNQSGAASTSFQPHVTSEPSEFRKPTIIRPAPGGGSSKRAGANSEASSSNKMPPSSQEGERDPFAMGDNFNLTPPRSDKMKSSSDDSALTYSPPEPQFPPPAPPPLDTVDAMGEVGSDTGDHWCRAMYDFRAENEDELSFSEGDLIRIEDFINLDWMVGSLRGKTGMVPLTFVELVQGPPSHAEASKSSATTPPCLFRVTALYAFDSDVPGDLNFQAGDEVEVLRVINPDWWYGRCSSREGQFPCNFVSRAGDKVANGQHHHQVCRAMYAFAGEVSGDLSFSEGDRILVTEVVNSDWWRGRLADDPFRREGIFPSAFVHPS